MYKFFYGPTSWGGVLGMGFWLVVVVIYLIVK